MKKNNQKEAGFDWKNILKNKNSKVAGVLAFSIIILICAFNFVNSQFLIEIPAYGGDIAEGIIGTPRFINPIFAQSIPDKDLVKLIYSGLVKEIDGEIVPDLAKNYTIDETGTIYTFELRPDALFHDGENVTSGDIVFTINTLQDFLIKSPYHGKWEGVSAEEIDQQTVVFKLKQPFSGFLDSLTVGILPKHLWENIPPEQFGFSEYNIMPVGSGPFAFSSLKRDPSGIPDEYVLQSNRNYTLGKPFLDKLILHFYQNEEELIGDYINGKIDNMGGISPIAIENSKIKDANININQYSLPRTFGLFFNSNQNSILRNHYIIEAIEYGIDKESIINNVLLGFGDISNSPIKATEDYASSYNPEQGSKLLERNGWKINPETKVREKKISGVTTQLSFSISTSNIDELKRTAELIKKQLGNIGISVEIKIFEPGNLQQDVIRMREYEGLLFGQIVEKDSDLFAFWHSSQRNDPGLNIALYTNKNIDSVLEKLRVESDIEKRDDLKQKFNKTITDEKPAVFLYHPVYIYIVDKDLRGIKKTELTNGEDRLSESHKWFVNTERVWDFLVKK